VAHGYNPSYLGDRGRRILSSRPQVERPCNPSYSGGSRFEASLGKEFEKPYLEKTHHNKKKGLVEWLKV
jgi:hypothetical protein